MKQRLYRWYVYAVVCLILLPIMPFWLLSVAAECVTRLCEWLVAGRRSTEWLCEKAESFAKRRGVELT